MTARHRRPRLRPFLLALVFLPAQAEAHGPLHEVIARMTELIAADPDNAQLHVQRGDLRRQHQEWAEAEADFARAALLDPCLADVLLGRAALLLDQGKAQDAEHTATAFLEKVPASIAGLLLRSRCRDALGRPVEAAADLDAVLAIATDPWPDVYLDRAALLRKAGAEHLDRALSGIDEGLKKCGLLLTLQLSAVDLELQLGRPDKALERVESVLKQQPENIDWLDRKVRLLRTAGRKEEADQACIKALAVLERLPPQRRSAPAMQELEKRLRGTAQP